MKSVIKIIKEQIESFYLIQRLAIFELKSTNNMNYLGLLWEVINPMIQIGIFWFVFGYGIREGKAVGDTPFLPWMLAGITVWFFANPAILQGTKSIHRRIKIIAKMNFPMSAIPSYVITAKLYQHFVLLGIIIIILHFFGYYVSIYYIQLPYYIFALFTLLFSITLISSTLATIVRDVQMLIQAFMRMLLYLTPLLWSPDTLPNMIQQLMKLNPLYYIVEGYRASLLGDSWYFIEHPEYTLYFWTIVFISLFIGSRLHLKFRHRFIDFL